MDLVARPRPRRGHVASGHAAATAVHRGSATIAVGPARVRHRSRRSDRLVVRRTTFGVAHPLPRAIPPTVGTQRRRRRAAPVVGRPIGHAASVGAVRRDHVHRSGCGRMAAQGRHVRLRHRVRHAGHGRGHRSIGTTRGLRAPDHLRRVLGVHRRPQQGRHGVHHVGTAPAHRRHLLARCTGAADAALPAVRRRGWSVHHGRRVPNRIRSAAAVATPLRGPVAGGHPRAVHR